MIVKLNVTCRVPTPVSFSADEDQFAQHRFPID